MNTKKKFTCTFFVMVSLVALFLIYSPISQAQNWAALPPYSTLWPLWSPALSPIDPVTGLPVPIVSGLTPGTVLPVQPGLTWDPAAANPWLLYNTPLGMAYYDPVGGVNMWPPPYLLDAAGGPLPLILPPDYAFLPPTSSSWINTNVPLANAAALAYLMTVPGAIIAPLATPIGPLATPIGPLATPLLMPVATPVFGIPTPIIGGLPLFLGASALIPPAVAPPPVPTVIAPPIVPTFVAPTIIAPTVIAPTIVPTFVAPTIIAPTVIAPTIVAPATALLPTAAVSGLLTSYYYLVAAGLI